jgi:hypothetical protein
MWKNFTLLSAVSTFGPKLPDYKVPELSSMHADLLRFNWHMFEPLTDVSMGYTSRPSIIRTAVASADKNYVG